MSHPERAREIQFRRNGRNISPKFAPRVWRRWFAAAPVSTQIQSETVAPRKPRDHLIPAAGVEAGGVAEEDNWIVSHPFPERDLHSVYRDSAFDGHS